LELLRQLPGTLKDKAFQESLARLDRAFSQAASQTLQLKNAAQTLLSERELEVLRAMAEGLSNQEISRRLFISTGTVKAHSSTIFRKLEVANRTEAIARAKDLSLI